MNRRLKNKAKQDPLEQVYRTILVLYVKESKRRYGKDLPRKLKKYLKNPSISVRTNLDDSQAYIFSKTPKGYWGMVAYSLDILRVINENIINESIENGE